MVVVRVSLLQRIQADKVGAGFEARRFDSNLIGLDPSELPDHTGRPSPSTKFNLLKPGGKINCVQMEPHRDAQVAAGPTLDAARRGKGRIERLLWLM